MYFRNFFWFPYVKTGQRNGHTLRRCGSEAATGGTAAFATRVRLVRRGTPRARRTFNFSHRRLGPVDAVPQSRRRGARSTSAPPLRGTSGTRRQYRAARIRHPEPGGAPTAWPCRNRCSEAEPEWRKRPGLFFRSAFGRERLGTHPRRERGVGGTVDSARSRPAAGLHALCIGL